MITDGDDLLTLNEAAERTAFSPVTLRAAERRGELRAFRLLGRLRFRASDLEAWIQSGLSVPRRVPPPELLATAARRGRRR